LVGALRAAIGASDAELLARMDADDRCHPDRLAKQLEMLDARPELAAVGSAVRCFPAELVAAGMRRYEEWLNSLLTPEQIAGDIFVESPMCHPSVTMRRTAYEAVGGYLDDGCPEDYHLWLRFHAHQLPMAKSPRVLLEWRESADRLTRVDPRYDHDRFFELKERYLLAGPLAERSRITIWGAGRNGRAWGRRLEARGRAIGAYVDVDRRKIGRAIRGVPIIAPEELEPCGSAQYLVAAVGTTGARPRIREFLHQRGLREPDHFVCVA